MAYTSSSIRVFVQFVLVAVLLLTISPVTKGYIQEEANSTVVLKIGEEINKEIKGSEAHSYQIALKKGQYLNLFLQAEKSGVEINILAPSKENVLRFETDRDKSSKETLEIVAKSTGIYLIEVASLDDAQSSHYKIDVKELRVALLKDRNRCIAKDLTEQANVLQRVGTPVGFQRSNERYLSAIPYWRKVGDRNILADIYRRMGENYYLTKNYQEALTYFGKELELVRSNNEKSKEARAIKNLGIVYYALGDEEQAMQNYSQALDLGKELNNKELIAQTLNLLATAYRFQGETRKSIEYNKESLFFWKDLNETEENIKINQDIAATYHYLAEIKNALEFYQKALNLLGKESNKNARAKTLTNIAIIYDEIGDFNHAISYYKQALNVWRELRSPNKESVSNEVEILNSLGELFYKLKDVTQALNNLEEAQELSKQLKDNVRQAKVLNNLANVYRDSGESRKSIEVYSDALMLHKQNNDLTSTANTATEVGLAHLNLGDGDKAVGFFTEAYKLNQRGGNRAIESKIFYNLGQALEFNYEEEKALAAYKQGIIVTKEIQNKAQEAQFFYKIGSLQKRQGKLKEAKVAIETAIEIIENCPSKFIIRELENNYSSKVSDYYELYVNVLMQQYKLNPSADDNIAALKISEKAKNFELSTLMFPAQVNFSYESMEDVVSKEKELKQLISDKMTRIIKFNVAERSENEIIEAEKELKALFQKLKDLQTEIAQKNQHYTNFSQQKTFDSKLFQEQVLDDDTILLEYSLGTEQSYLWMVTKTEIKSFALPKRDEIESLAKYLRELVTAQNLIAKGENIGGRQMTLELATNEYPKVATELSKILLSPIAEKLGKKRLIVVSDGALQYLPFNALPNPNQLETYEPILIKNEVVLLPSASTINSIRQEHRENNQKTVMFVADPVLSAVDSRVKGIVSKNNSTFLSEIEETNSLIKKSAKEVGLPITNQGLLQLVSTGEQIKLINEVVAESKQFLGFNASLRTLGKEVSSHKVVQFATHSLANSQHPELSGIVLSLVDEQGKPQDGFLQIHKIFNLHLPTELVVLSNCETSFGKNAQAQGLTGLTRSFIYAGAERVLVSLWNTNDPVSTQMIKQFYQKVLKESQTPASALRTVQLELLKDEKYKNPFYWAGFQLHGDWK